MSLLCDNVTLKYFATQPKLSSKQVRWQYTLALFNVDIRHKSRKENIVPDALSRKHQLRVVYVGESKLQKEVRLASRRDVFAKEVRQNIQNVAKSHFHLRNGLLLSQPWPWLATKARGLQGCGLISKPGSHTTRSRECKECEGVNPHTP